MSEFLHLLLVVAVLIETNATLVPSKLSLSTDDADEEFSTEDWNEPEIPYPLLQSESYGDEFQVLQKRSGSDTLTRRSSLDKNFMRFGRSGFFPRERCCKHKDLIGFSGSWPNAGDPIALTKRNVDDGFMRFGRSIMRLNRGDKNNFLRFGKGDKDNFMRFGKGDKGSFMRFGRGDKDNFMRFGRGDKDNFMRFGRGDKDNFMRFGRGDKDNFMRFGRGDKDNFMRFGRGDKDNFMRFGRGDKDNFMRFGRGDKDNFMRFGKGDKDNFMRFGRGDKDNFMRFGKSDESFPYPEEHSSLAANEDEISRATRSDNFMRFGKSIPNHSGFFRYGKSGGKDDSFIRFGKSSRNGTHFLRFGRGHGEAGDAERDKVEEGTDDDGSEDGGLKNVPVVRRKRMAAESNFLPALTRTVRNPEIADEVPSHVHGTKRSLRSLAEESVSRPNILKFISLINSNHPEGASNLGSQKSVFSRPDMDKRQLNGNGFIRFG